MSEIKTVEGRLRAIEDAIRAGKAPVWTDTRDLVLAIRAVHTMALDWDETFVQAGIEPSLREEIQAGLAQEIFQALEGRLVPGEQRATA